MTENPADKNNFPVDRLLAEAHRALSDTKTLGSLGRLPERGRCAGTQPNAAEVKEIVQLCRQLIFPGYFGSADMTESNLTFHTGLAIERLHSLLADQIAASLSFGLGDCRQEIGGKTPSRLAALLIDSLPQLRVELVADAEATFRGDPAAASVREVVYSYPGLKALVNYRIGHRLHQLGVPVLPRMITEMAHSETGIDIHPGASIGPGLMIDHGTGVVVGATAVIGMGVRLYQGVTLGARSFPTDEEGNAVKGQPRHPVIGDGVVIYANTTLLGRIHVGDGAVIGGNLWVTFDVGAGEKIVQARPDNILRIKSDAI